MSHRLRNRAHPEFQRHNSPVLSVKPVHTAEATLRQRPANELERLLLDPHVSSSARRSVALQIGQTHGNRYLQRALASIQRQTDPTLRQGSNGAAVQALQQLLINAGANVTADGIFGAKTRQAVVAFQQSAGLTPDGIVGPKTWTALHNGGVTIGAGGGNPVATQAIVMKIQQIKQLMQQFGGASSHDQAIEGSTDTEVGETPNPQYDSENGEEEESWWDSATSAASSAWDSASETASDTWDSVSEAASETWDSVSESASEAWDTVTEAASETWDAATGIVGDIVDETVEQVGEIVNTVRETVNGGIDTVVQEVSEIASEIGQAVEEFGSDLKEQFADEIAAVEEIYNDIKHFIENPEDALRKLDEILNGLQKKANTLFGSEEEEGKEDVSGSVGAITLDADPNICHDEKTQSSTPKKLRVQLHYEPTQYHEMPTDMGMINHDGIQAMLDYTSDISSGDADIVQVPSTDFGSTGSRFTIGKFDYIVYSNQEYVFVKGAFNHRIAWDITETPGRTNVPASLDGIDEFNWKEAADDLDPDLHKTELGAPKRDKYWAMDITQAHELFHAKDRDEYTRTIVLRYILDEFNKRQIEVPFFDTKEAIERQLKQIADEIGAQARKLLNTYIAPPAGEQRAYRADEHAYRLRAGAIRAKAIQNGWFTEDKKKK